MSDPVSAQLARIEALIGVGRFQESALALQSILADDPANSRAFCLLAQCYLQLNQPEAALRAAATAIGLDPERPWPHRLLSIAEQRLGRHTRAVGPAREALRLNPHDWLNHAHLASVLNDKKSSRREAQAAAAEAVRLAPNEAQAHLATATVALARRKRNEAESAIQLALALEPDNTQAHNMLATAQWRRGKLLRSAPLAAAADGYATAIRTNPHSRTSRYNLDALLRTFLARLAYFIWIVAWLTRAALNSPNLGTRLLPACLLLVPGTFAARFVRQLSPQLRSYLATLAIRTRLAIPVGLMTISAAALVIAPFTPGPHRDGFAIAISGSSSLAARIYLAAQNQKHERAFKGKTGFFTNDALWFIAVVSALAAIGATFIRPLVFGLIWVAIAGTFSALSFGTLYRRRRHTQATA